MGRTTNAKPKVVVAVVGIVVVAVGGARVVLVVVPGAAAQHTPSRFREPHWLSQPLHYAFMCAAVQIMRKGASRPAPLTRRYSEDSATVNQ